MGKVDTILGQCYTINNHDLKSLCNCSSKWEIGLIPPMGLMVCGILEEQQRNRFLMPPGINIMACHQTRATSKQIGIIGNCQKFDGNNDYIIMPNRQ